MDSIRRTTPIEELVDRFPGSVRFLIDQGLPCLVCGEPNWGTLEELARDKGWNDGRIDDLVERMNTALSPAEAA